MSWFIAAAIWRRREEIRQASEDDLMDALILRALPPQKRQKLAGSIAHKIPYLLVFFILAC